MKFKFTLLFCWLLIQVTAQPKAIDDTTYKEGLQANRQGEYELAVQHFSTFLSQHPSHSLSYYYRGHSYMILKKYAEALADFEQLCLLDSKDEENFYAAGRAAFALGNMEKAVQYFSKTISIEPFHAFALNDRGMSYCHLKAYDKAVSDFKKAVVADSSFAMAYNNIGAARYFNQDIAKPSDYDLREAKKYFSKAIELDNTLFIAYFNRAAMNYFLEDFSTALYDLNKAAALNPTEALTYFYKGMIYRKQDNNTAAIAAFEQSLEMNDQLKFAYEEIANTYKKQENYSAALTYYDKAQTLDKSQKGKMYSGLINYRKAVVYALQGNESAMFHALSEAKKLKVFSDKKVYQDFLNEAAFRQFRLEKKFIKLSKSIKRIKKYNKFTDTELNWFRMSM